MQYRYIRRIDNATGIISTIAGNGTRVNAGDGGLAIDAGLSEPTAVFPSRNYYYRSKNLGLKRS